MTAHQDNDCSWCGADLSDMTVIPTSTRGERFCSKSHRDASARAVRRIRAPEPPPPVGGSTEPHPLFKVEESPGGRWYLHTRVVHEKGFASEAEAIERTWALASCRREVGPSG